KTSIFSHPVYLFLREFSLQDFRGGSIWMVALGRYGEDRLPGASTVPGSEKIQSIQNLTFDGVKMAYILSMSEQVKQKALLAVVLDDYDFGAISQQQAFGGIASLIDAMEISDTGRIKQIISEGRKLLRMG
ncbi:hypothetical protein, partial [Escherichia coli]|uniref:hypothetical protein n=3 Tax=Enterobacteriaceae TaxID=543 RepID=UPI001FCE9785